ncbi:hypothetical protein FN846DRAFT_894604 [Sphaerosporella brunnea]|uniref:Uncharacterized protein n=1 Tax=Sphaerosporella brunnea TaxID=1250544 RepID=A0A5J5EHQ4_9PEZI|nr:hypothetical protein FN846DRAFT_894604 [Sphaerosporella brunnea]
MMKAFHHAGFHMRARWTTTYEKITCIKRLDQIFFVPDEQVIKARRFCQRFASERAQIEARKNKRGLENAENPLPLTAPARSQYWCEQRTKKARAIDLTEGGWAYQDIPAESKSQETQELDAAFEEGSVAGKLPPPGASQANPIDLSALDIQEQAWIHGYESRRRDVVNLEDDSDSEIETL